MRHFFLSCVAILAATPAFAAEPAKPNVLIVMTDDQGLGDFSFTGNPVLKTPNLDAFARESVRLHRLSRLPDVQPDARAIADGPGRAAKRRDVRHRRPNVPAARHPDAGRCVFQCRLCDGHFRQVAPGRLVSAPADRQGISGERVSPRLGQLQSTPEFDWPLIDGRYFHNGEEKRYTGALHRLLVRFGDGAG